MNENEYRELSDKLLKKIKEKVKNQTEAEEIRDIIEKKVNYNIKELEKYINDDKELNNAIKVAIYEEYEKLCEKLRKKIRAKVSDENTAEIIYGEIVKKITSGSDTREIITKLREYINDNEKLNNAINRYKPEEQISASPVGEEAWLPGQPPPQPDDIASQWWECTGLQMHLDLENEDPFKLEVKQLLVEIAKREGSSSGKPVKYEPYKDDVKRYITYYLNEYKKELLEKLISPQTPLTESERNFIRYCLQEKEPSVNGDVIQEPDDVDYFKLLVKLKLFVKLENVKKEGQKNKNTT